MTPADRLSILSGAQIGIMLLCLVALGGCISSDDGPNPFALCGNGVIDKHEVCDDGNVLDNDDCLSTCVPNQCGDEFLDTQGPNNIEMCDGRILAGQTCASLGFPGGTLSCAADCTFDTSACTSKPTPTLTPPPTPTATAR